MKTKRISREQRKDWKNLPYEHWNTITVHAYFKDMNREMFGVNEYLPMRNWRFEQGVIKQALNKHGAEKIRLACDEIFRTYRPTDEYPHLTAGFALLCRLNTVLPKINRNLEMSTRDYEKDDIKRKISYL